MKHTPKTKVKNTPVSATKSTRILTGSVAALLTIAAVGTAAQAATLVRLDLGGNGFPDAGFVEYKASSTYADRIAVDTDRDGVGTIGYTESHNAGGAWFGSTGSNIWDHRDISGSGSNLFSGLLDTATGSATGIGLTINNANRSNDGGQEGDWRGSQLGVSRISAGGLNAASSAGMNWTITGLLANTATELWIYANDKNYDGTAYTVTGATTVSLIDPARYTGNWTKRDESSIYNGYGWGMTVTTDSFGTLTGWAKENSEIRGLQIYQASATVTWLGPVDGNWSSAPTWSTGAVPTNSTPAVIDTASLVTVDGTHAAASLAVSNQGKLEVSTGNSLAVSGPITVAAVSAGSAVTMGHNTTLSAQSGAIASVSAGGNVTVNVTGAGQKLTVPAYVVSAPSVLTKGGAGELVLTGNGTATPLGATTALNLNGGTLTFSRGGFTAWTPTLVSGVNAWFDASAIVGATNGQNLASWDDLSSGNHDATRVNGQMNYTTNAVNGLPAVQFRGQGRANLSGSLFSSQEYAVFTLPNGGDWGAILGSGNDQQGYLMNHEGYMWDGRYPRGVSKNGVALPINYNVGNNNPYMVIKIDNRNGNTGTTGDWRLGGQEGWNNFDMNLAEVISVDHDLNATEEGQIGGYLAGKYGITTTYSTPAPIATVSGSLDMASTNIVVTGNTTLNAITDSTATFGSLSISSGIVTAQGAIGGITFTGNTTLAAAATGGVTAGSATNIGALTIGNGGTFVGSGPITASSITLSGADGGISTNGAFSVANYNDGGVAKTLRFGGAGTVSIDNTANTFHAANTTIRVNGGTLDATNSGSNDGLGGSTSIQLNGGTLKVSGVSSIQTVNGLTAELYYIGNNASQNLRFDQGSSLLGTTPITTVLDTGLGSFNGGGIAYQGDDAPNGFRALFPAQAQMDNFSVVWTGKWTAPASGGYNFYAHDLDDSYTVYVDLNQNGTFESNELRNEGNAGGGAQGGFSLTSGQQYKVALGFGEGGGGNSVRFYLDTPGLGSFNLNPSSGTQAGWWSTQFLAVGALNLASKEIEVLANSGLNAVSDVSATFGALTFTNGVMTVSGNPLTSFAVTSVDASATQVGFISAGTINTGPVFGNGFTGTFVKGGSGNLTLNSANSGLGNATFDVQAGRLTALSAAGLGGSSNVKLSGGQLFLSSNGGDQAYDIGMDVAQNSTLTVGKDATSGVNAPVTVTLGSAAKTLTVRNGKTLTVNATDSYTLDLNNSLAFEDNAVMTISGAGVDVNILGATTLSMNNGSTLNLNAGTMHTDHAVSVYNLNLNGGVLSLDGTGSGKSLNVNGTLTVNNSATNLNLTGGALLTTAGNATINLQNGTIITDSALNVGNLTVEAGGTLNRTGALAADRNVSVGDKLRLVNKTFSTVGSALSVGNRIELDNSTLAFDNSLSFNSIRMDNNSHFVPAAGTTTNINGTYEAYSGSTADFTGSTLATRRFRMENNGTTLTVRNNLNTVETNEIYQSALVDLGAFNLTTNFQNLHIAHNNSELRATSSSTLDINFLQIYEGGKLNVPSVRIRDAVWLGTRTVNAFNITEENPGKRLEAHQGGVDNYTTNSHVYLTGTNLYTGETQMHDATVLVAQQGVGLPNASMVRFQNGVLGTSGTFAREIGDGVDGAGLGKVRFNSWGGFAGFGGALTVSLTTANAGNRIDWNSYDNGFNNQGLRLGAAFDSDDVTLTNNIQINGYAQIGAYSLNHLSTLSGNLTGGDTLDKQGPGTLILSGNNSGFSGRQYIRRGALDVGANGSHLGTGRIDLQADNADNNNKGAVLQASGALSLNVGNDAGMVRWEDNGGGFSARGGNLSVTLNGGSTIEWNSESGFRGRNLMFGSSTANGVVTFANDINYQNDYKTIWVFDNPNTTSDKAVMAGNLTNIRGFEKRGDGWLETHGNAGLLSTSGDQVRIYNSGTLKVVGDLRAGNAYSGGDPRHFGASENNIEFREGGKLVVTGNAQTNYFYMEDNGTSSDTQSATIAGNLNIKDRIELNNGTMTVGGNVTSGEGYNIRNKSNLVINGNAQVGLANGNSADRDVYVENGGDLTFNGNVLTNRLQATGKNSNGRASTIHVNGTAIVGNTGSSNMHFNADNPTTGGGLDGSGTVSFNYANFENGARLGGALTLNVKDRVVFEGNNGILAPGNGAGTLTVNGSLTLNGGSSYYFDAGDMVNVNAFASSNTGSELIANDNWNLNFQTGGSTFATGGSIQLFQYTNLGSFDTTPNYNVSALIAAGWLPGSFDTSTLSLTASGGVVTLFGLQRQPIIWTGDSSGPGNNLWSTGSNWATPVSVANVLTFAGINRTSPVNDLTANSSFAGLQFDASAGAFTITGNALDLTGDITSASANTQTLNVAINLANTVKVNTGAGDLVIGGNLSGGGGLTKQGAGTLTLGGVNAQTGTTRIEAGVLVVANDGNLGAAGASLQFAGGTLAPAAALTTSRPVNVAAGTSTLDTTGGNTTFNGAISGAGTLNKEGIGTLSLTGTSTFTGTTNVNAGALVTNAAGLGGNVVLSSTNVTFEQGVDGTTAASVSGTGNLIKNGAGVLTVAAPHTYNGQTQINVGTLRLSGTIITNGIYETILDASHDSDAANNIQQMRTYAAGPLGTGDGQGILTTQFNYPTDASFTARMAVLNPGNTFNENDFSAVWTTTFVPTAAGQWDFKFDNNDDTASIWVDKDQDGIFESSGAQGDERIADRGGCCGGAEGGWSGFTNGQQYLVGFAMSDSGGGGYLDNVQFRGGGGAFSSYTGINPTGAGQSGLWSVVAGSPPNLLPIGTTVVMAASTVFDVNGAVQQIAALSGPANTSVTLGAGGNLTISSSDDASYGGVISGAGTLTKSGSNTLTLAGVNTHTVATVVNQGTLSVGADTALGATGSGGAKLKFTGGTLQTTASLTSDRPVEVSTGGGTFDSNGFNSTLSGAYSGTGSLTKDGVGELSLTGTSTNTAAMNVNEGTLRGNTDSLKGNVVLANASNVAFDQSTDGTYTKSVSGEGNLTKAGDAVLTVQGTHTYIGETLISGGTLKLAANPGFRYYRFQVTSNVNSDLSQQSEIGFFSSGTNPSNGTRVFATSVIGDGGDNGDGGWAALNDNDLNTKATYNGLPGLRYVTFDFGTAFAATGYDWATANDSTPDRNPNNWTVYASNDNSTFTLIDTRTGQGTTPTSNFTWAAGWALSLGGGGAGSNKLPVGTTVKMASGTTLNLNNIDQQVGALADASGSPTGHVVQLAGATLSIGDAGSAETTFSGDIIGSGTDAVEKNGTSVQNLNGAQQYDHLTVSGGTLNVNGEIGTDPANGTASVTVTGAGTVLKFGSVSQTLSTLTIGDGATLTFGSGAASGAFSGGGVKGASLGGGSVVPEPGTIGLLLVGAIGVLNRRRRQG